MKKYDWMNFYWKDLFKKFLPQQKNRIEFLKSTAFFAGFSDRQIALTSEFLHERKFRKDEHIFELGHPGAALYFIESGKVSIEIPQEHQSSIQLASLTDGNFFGELALLDEEPRSASARAESDCKLLALPRSEMQRMLVESPMLGGLIFRALAQINSARLKAVIEKMQKEERPAKLVVNG